MNHGQVQDLLPGYALGALELRAQEDLLEHLQSCPACYRLTQEQLDVAARLAAGITKADPPGGLQARVQASVAQLSIPTQPRVTRARPYMPRLGIPAWGPTFAASVTASIALAALGVILAIAVISQGDLGDLRDENITLKAKLDEQIAGVALSRAALAQQDTALAASQANLEQLSELSHSVSGKLDEQRGLFATSQETLTGVRQDNEKLAARISDQDAVLAKSQGSIDDLGKQNLVLAAIVNEQRIFTYLQALPGINKFVLKATSSAPGTFGLLVTNAPNVWGVAMLLGVDPPKLGMAYQLWLEKDGVATSGGLIPKIDPATRFGQVYIPKFPQPVNTFKTVFVTLEPDTGSPTPTGPVLLSAPIN